MSGDTAIPDGLLTLLVAGSCVLAIGMCSTTLDSTVTTNPDDVIDLPADLVPIGKGTLEDIKRNAAKPIPDDRAGDTGDPEEDLSGPDESGHSPDVTVDQPDPSQEPSQGQDRDQSTTQANSGMGTGPQPPGPLERLADLLQALIPYLVVLAGILVVLYYYRERILAYLWDLVGEDETVVEEGWPELAPTNEVARAWLTMIRDLGVERDPAKTPSEYAADAIRIGGDGTAIQTLTDLFQEVRYGGVPVTNDRVTTARAALSRLRDRTGSTTETAGDGTLGADGDGGGS